MGQIQGYIINTCKATKQTRTDVSFLWYQEMQQQAAKLQT